MRSFSKPNYLIFQPLFGYFQMVGLSFELLWTVLLAHSKWWIRVLSWFERPWEARSLEEIGWPTWALLLNEKIAAGGKTDWATHTTLTAAKQGPLKERNTDPVCWCSHMKELIIIFVLFINFFGVNRFSSSGFKPRDSRHFEPRAHSSAGSAHLQLPIVFCSS